MELLDGDVLELVNGVLELNGDDDDGGGVDVLYGVCVKLSLALVRCTCKNEIRNKSSRMMCALMLR